MFCTAKRDAILQDAGSWIASYQAMGVTGVEEGEAASKSATNVTGQVLIVSFHTCFGNVNIACASHANFELN